MAGDFWKVLTKRIDSSDFEFKLQPDKKCGHYIHKHDTNSHTFLPLGFLITSICCFLLLFSPPFIILPVSFSVCLIFSLNRHHSFFGLCFLCCVSVLVFWRISFVSHTSVCFYLYFITSLLSHSIISWFSHLFIFSRFYHVRFSIFYILSSLFHLIVPLSTSLLPFYSLLDRFRSSFFSDPKNILSNSNILNIQGQMCQIF